MTATAANSALPVGFRKKIAADFGSHAKKRAAGIIFMDPMANVLMLRRSMSEPNFAGHFAWPGGGVEEGEEPLDGAVREAVEEIGGNGDFGGGDSVGSDSASATDPKPKEVDRVETPSGAVFHTFLAPVEKQFVPRLNGEHIGYTWTPLNALPRPLHPAVEATLKNQFGVGDDIAEDWDATRDDIVKWSREPQAEHMTGDSALTLALDRDSVRTKDKDGRLKVARTHISKANVCPYRGSEIPGYAELGLDADKIYHLLRDPEELRKAAPTLNGVPLLRKHIPVSAADHQPDEVVGSIGSEAVFDGDYLDNSLYVNAQEAIDGIENGAKRELSAGYHYTPDMTPGTYKGTAYDGVMRDIHFNHVALVEDGRAGPDVVVGDSTENLKMATRIAALALNLTAGVIAPMIAMDQKIELPKKLFGDLTSKNLKSKKKELLAGVKLAVDGKLKKGLAFDESRLAKLIDALAETGEGVDESVSKEQHNAMEAAAHGNSDLGIPQTVAEEFVDKDKGKTFDTAAVRDWLTGKGMSGDDLAEFDTTFAPPAKDEDPDKKDDDDKNKKDGAEDEDDDEAKKKAEEDEKAKAKDAAMKDVVTKPAMDAALDAHGKAVEKRVIERERGIRTAIATVKPWVGEMAPDMAFDSAESVYRHTLTALGIDGAKDLHADALLPVLKAQPKPGARPNVIGDVPLGMDASAADSLKKITGVDLDRIGAV
jgi:8-oxo-dGTP pyrophosphatase MutT (NUDIX family)